MTRIGDDVAATFDHGLKSGVGTTAVPLATASFKATRGVRLKAAAGNAGTVFVGNSDVTGDDTDATDGYPLAAGDELLLPIDDPAKVYVLASTSGQKVYWLAI